jgi:hypothetical protein
VLGDFLEEDFLGGANNTVQLQSNFEGLGGLSYFNTDVGANRILEKSYNQNQQFIDL